MSQDKLLSILISLNLNKGSLWKDDSNYQMSSEFLFLPTPEWEEINSPKE